MKGVVCVVDGELNFITKLDRTGFDRGTKAINNGLGNLKSSLKSLAKIAAAAFSVKMIYDFAKASKEAYNVQIEQETKLATIMKQRNNATDDEIQSVKQLAAEQQKLGVIGDEVQLAGAQQVATFLNETDSIKTLLPAMNDLLAQQNGLNASTSDAVNIGNLMGKVLQGQTSALKRVGISFSEAEDQVLKYGTESQKAAMLAQVITNNVGHMNQALAQTDAGKQKQLANTMSDVKEQFGQAVMQIESVFLPVIQLLADGLSKVASVAQAAGRAIKEAFGVESEDNSATIATTTANAAASAADSYEDIADSAEETKKAQENSLASFDKIIKLNNVKNEAKTSTGSKKKATTIPVKIEPVTKKKNVLNWAEELKKAIKKGDWNGVGKLFAEKVNNAFGKINWEKVKTKVGNAASNLANGINGFAENLNWKKIGEDIGGAINTAFTFAYKFLTTTKWKTIGSGLATTLNGIISKTDFKKVGSTLGAKTNALVQFAWGLVKDFDFAKAGLGLADIVNGWFDEVNWDELGDTLGGMIQGVIEVAYGFVSNLNFKAVAEDFAAAFNKVIDRINFKMLGETVSKAFKGVWDFIGTALERINWVKVGNSISEFINGINWWGILDSMFKVIGTVIKKAPQFLLGVVEKLDFSKAAGMFAVLFAPKIASKLLSKFLGDDGIKGKLSKAGSAILSKIGSGISTALDKLKTVCSKIVSKIRSETTDKAEGIGSSFGNKFKTGLTSAAAVIGAAVAGWELGSLIYKAAKPGIDKITNALTDAMNADKYVKSNDNKIDTSNKLTVANLKKKGAWWLSKNDSGATLQRAANIINEAKKLGIAINDVYYQNGNYQKALEKLKESQRITDANKKLPSASSGNVKDTAKSKNQEQLRTYYKNLAKKEAAQQTGLSYGIAFDNTAKSIYNTKYKKKYNLPAYATGTVVPANFGRFAAILGDNKKEPEVVSPVSTMRQAVMEALALTQGKSKQPVIINLSIDTRSGKRLLSKQLIDDINDITASTGKVPINIPV